MMKSLYLRQMPVTVLIITLLGVGSTMFGQGLNPGQIGDPQTICYGSAPRRALSFNTLPSGGTGPYSFQWQRSDYSVAGPWENLSGSTRNTYFPPVLGKNTWFRCLVRDALNVEGETNVIMITVLSNLNAGRIGESQTICSGSAPNALIEVTGATGGGGSNYSYQWQSSPSGTSWTNIQGATGTSFAPPALITRTYYKRLVIDEACGTKGSNYVLISVQPQPAAQFHIDRNAIGYRASANLSVIIDGGTAPYTVNYTVNGEVQEPIENYASGSNFSTGFLTTGEYEYALISVTDAGGCSASINGSPVTLEVNNDWTYNFTYPDRGNLLADGWDFIAMTPEGTPRNTEQLSGEGVVSYDQTVHPGVLRIPADEGSLYEWNNDSRNSFFRDLPPNWASIRLHIASFNPVRMSQRASLVLYQNDANYLQLTRTYAASDRQVMYLINESDDGATIINPIPEAAISNILMRIDRDPVTETISSWYSLDGGNVWNFVGDALFSQPFSSPRLGIVTGESPAGILENADFSWAEVSTQPAAIIDTLSVQPGSLVFNTVAGHPAGYERSLFISTKVGRQISLTQGTDVPWLTAELLKGHTEAILKVRVNTNGLESGTYQGNVTVSSSQTEPLTVPVTLIVNPAVPVRAATWRDGRAGAMSVSVDDGHESGFEVLQRNGFKGTYVYNGNWPPDHYTTLYEEGMELGSHTTNHIYGYIPRNDILRNEEYIPNINGICNHTPQPCSDVITLVWPSGLNNFRSQAVASEYFLAARGYNINQLEEATPSNLMNIKSYNDFDDILLPPPVSNFRILIDNAVTQGKWFNLVLHGVSNSDDAIDYAATTDIWVSSIGSVVKYILQRDRFILNDFASGDHFISFNASRLAIPASPVRSFETAFGPSDITTLEIDIDDSRVIESVTVDGAPGVYRRVEMNGNYVLLLNVMLDPSVSLPVEVRYIDETLPRIHLDRDAFEFSTTPEGDNPVSQLLNITSSNAPSLAWSVSITDDGANWLQVIPSSGTGPATLTVSADRGSLSDGTYHAVITVTSPDVANSPQTANVSFTVRSPVLALSSSHLSFTATLNEAAPSGQLISISNSSTSAVLDWSATASPSWLSVNPGSGNTPAEMTVTIDHSSLGAGTYTGSVTVSSVAAANSPQEILVRLTVNQPGVFLYDFTYPDRGSLLADGWDFIAMTPGGTPRNTEQLSGEGVVSYDQTAHPGVLRIPVDNGSLWEWNDDTRNSLFHDLPSGWTSIRLRIESFAPVQSSQLAGLVLYHDDDNYIQLNRTFAASGYQVVHLIYESGGNAEISASEAEAATSGILLRIDRNPVTETISSWYSLDGGNNWIVVGSVLLSQEFTSPRLGIVTGESPQGVLQDADFAWAEIRFDDQLKSRHEMIMPDDNAVAGGIKLYQNYPNPVTVSTMIDYKVTEGGHITIELFSQTGEKIETIVNQYLSAGDYQTEWIPGQYLSGMYYLVLKSGIESDFIKILILK